MATPPQLKRLVIEELPEDVRKWAGKLVEPINTFMEEVHACFQHKITIGQNLAGEIRTVTATFDDTDGGPVFSPVSFVYRVRPRAILLGGIVDEDNDVPALTDGLAVLWTYTQDGMIKVNNIAGLPDGKYYVTLVILES